jgi:predicted transglutaminase-like cysteine proteinase
VRAISIFAAAIFAVGAQVTSTPAEAQAQRAFPSYSEIALHPGNIFPKWQLVSQRLGEEAGAVERCMVAGDCGSEAAEEIASELQGLSSEPRLEQADAVHRLMNSRPYREDRRQFGRNDVWQTPFAFWQRGGDCEDYAIAKYMALRVLGFSEDQLRLTVMTSRSRGEVHAVLLVEVDGAWHVADNLRRGLRRLDGYDGWTPIYSVSDAGAWRYVAEPFAAGQKVASAEPTVEPEPAAPVPGREGRTRL